MAEHKYDSWCRKRRERIAGWLRENNIAAAVFTDSEKGRDPAIRYFTGHPGDAVLVLSAEGRAVLSPWDENLAGLMAAADIIVPYTAFDLDPLRAVSGLLPHTGIPAGARVEIPRSTSYPDFLKYVDALQDYSVICRESDSAHQAAQNMRAVKDDYELECIRNACRIAGQITGLIEEGARDGRIKTEIDAALLVERESRLRGAEGVSFATLAAGPGRSFGIHCFPPYTAAAFPGEGLSLLDFGVLYEGYASDVTLTIAKGALKDEQERQLALVQKAYDEALALYKPGLPVLEAAQKVKAVFGRAKRELPHGLGHGIGLEVHERPFVRMTAPPEAVFEPGMTVTLEPGLYHAALGGVRLENDILITESGNETLTASKIIRF